jgi:hypothetical protein
MLAICIFIGLTVLFPTATLGADWKFLQRNANGDFFYDAENITYSSEQMVGVWLKVVYSERFKEQESLNNFSQTIGFWEISCRDGMIRLLSSSHHSKGEEMLPPSHPRVYLTPDWEPIPANTVLDALRMMVCK